MYFEFCITISILSVNKKLLERHLKQICIPSVYIKLHTRATFGANGIGSNKSGACFCVRWQA